MFTATNDFLTGRASAVAADEVNLHETRFELTWGAASEVTSDLALNNNGAIGVLPAGCRPKFLTLDADAIDGGVGLQYTIGILSEQARFYGYISGTALTVTQVVSGAVAVGQVLVANGITKNTNITAANTVNATQTLGSAAAPVLLTGWDISTAANDGGGAWLTGVQVGRSVSPPAAIQTAITAAIQPSPIFSRPMAKVQSVQAERLIGIKVTGAPATPAAGSLALTLFYRQV
jgi:hypothetical protein